MELVAKTGGVEVILLIDSWASHNFISTILVEKLGLPIRTTESYYISVGARGALKGQGLCKELRLTCKGWRL